MQNAQDKWIHFSVEVHGRVQGVGFRYSAQNEAKRLGITGYVRNSVHGTVNLEIEGRPENVRTMIEWCRQGPSMAYVERVDEWPGDMQNYRSFNIR